MDNPIFLMAVDKIESPYVTATWTRFFQSDQK